MQLNDRYEKINNEKNDVICLKNKKYQNQNLQKKIEYVYFFFKISSFEILNSYHNNYITKLKLNKFAFNIQISKRTKNYIFSLKYE